MTDEPRYTETAVALRELMRAHGLTQRRVAELALVGHSTVEGWLAPVTAASHRNMPRRHLALIRMALEREGGR